MTEDSARNRLSSLSQEDAEALREDGSHGHLQTLKHLGRGSSAMVSKCSISTPKHGEQLVAMKMIHAELLDNPQVHPAEPGPLILPLTHPTPAS
jgi:hypothetical protein